MRLIVNGKPGDFKDEATLADVLGDLKIDSLRVATLVNDHVIRRDNRADTHMKAGDRVEAFTFACGG